MAAKAVPTMAVKAVPTMAVKAVPTMAATAVGNRARHTSLDSSLVFARLSVAMTTAAVEPANATATAAATSAVLVKDAATLKAAITVKTAAKMHRKLLRHLHLQVLDASFTSTDPGEFRFPEYLSRVLHDSDDRSIRIRGWCSICIIPFLRLPITTSFFRTCHQSTFR